MNLLKLAGSGIAGGLDTLSAVYSHPIKMAISLAPGGTKPSDVVKLTKQEGPTKTIVNTVVNTATAATALYGLGTAAGRAAISTGSKYVATTAAKKAVEHPIKATAAAAITVVAANALIESPKAQKAVISTPSNLASFGQGIGKVIENPSIASAKNLVSEHPVLTAGVGLGAAALVGAGTAGIVSNLANTKAIKENTDVMKQGNTTALEVPYAAGNLTTAPMASPGTYIIVNPAPPVAAAEENLTTAKKTTTKKKKKKKKKKTTYKRKKKKTIKRKKTTKKKKKSKKRK